MSEPMQRVGPLAGIPALLQELDVEIDEVLEGLEIQPEDLFADNRIPFRSALHLLDRCAQTSGCDHFGALLGTRFEFSDFGLIADALKCAPTLRDAIEDFVSVQAGFSQGLSWYFVPFDDCAAFGIADDREQKGREQSYGFNVAFAVNGDPRPVERQR